MPQRKQLSGNCRRYHSARLMFIFSTQALCGQSVTAVRVCSQYSNFGRIRLDMGYGLCPALRFVPDHRHKVTAAFGSTCRLHRDTTAGRLNVLRQNAPVRVRNRFSFIFYLYINVIHTPPLRICKHSAKETNVTDTPSSPAFPGRKAVGTEQTHREQPSSHLQHFNRYKDESTPRPREGS